MRQSFDVTHGRHFGCAERCDNEGIFAVLTPEGGRNLVRPGHVPFRERAMMDVVDWPGTSGTTMTSPPRASTKSAPTMVSRV